MKLVTAPVLAALFVVGCDNSPTLPEAFPRPAPSMSIGAGVPFQAVAAGERFSCALNAQGVAFCWGRNSFGSLGAGDTDDATTPRQVVGPVAFASLSAAGLHACALDRAGSAYCWGLNDVGQLGSSAGDVCTTAAGRQVECSLRPVAVAGDLRFGSVDVGWQHACGVTRDGAVYCWGWNEFNQLGASTIETCLRAGAFLTPCSRTPVPVSGGLRFRSISAGFWQTCGVTSSGDTFCWGNNIFGLYGDGTTSSSATPVPGANGVTLSALSSGATAACGITRDRTTVCWGSPNAAGELGDGTRTGHLTPLPIAGDFVQIRSVSTMAENNFLGHVCGIAGDGETRCWGSDRRGQLGAATSETCVFATLVFDCSSVPLTVSGGFRFQSIAAGFEHTCGATRSGDVLCWGLNDRGQVGDGSTTDRPEPVAVAFPSAAAVALVTQR